MDISKIQAFLKKNNFIENKRDGSYVKKVDSVFKRYRFKDNAIFIEVKRNDLEEYQLIAYGDIRDTYLNDKGQITGVKRAIPEYSMDKIKQMKDGNES